MNILKNIITYLRRKVGYRPAKMQENIGYYIKLNKK